MKRLLNAGIVLLVYLSLLLNIDRLDVQGWVPIATFVYVLCTLSVLVNMVVPLLRRQQTGYALMFWGLVYVLSKLLVFNQHPFWGENYTFITILELAVYLLAVYFTKQFTQHLSEAGNLIEQAIVPNMRHQVLSLAQAGSAIETEFMRSRRYDYPICALMVEPECGAENWPLEKDLERAVREIEMQIRRKYAATELAEAISNHTRQTDLVVDLGEPGQFLLICPDITTDNAEKFMGRLQQAVQGSLGVKLRYGMALFPQDAPSFEGVLQVAESNMR